MAPFHPGTHGVGIEFMVFLAIGMAFGAVLEMSGFGDSRKLSAQFYLKDMAVLKVMFTAIITAAVLIHLAAALQLLDLSRVWVNPTYLWPGIAGGLIMGVGFIVGGFCPGTSLVAAATLKLDGVAFVLGGLFGVFAFGETVHHFDNWWQSSAFGRFTLDEWLHVPAGVAVLLVVLMALAMFAAGEVAERRFGAAAAPPPRLRIAVRPARLAASLLLVVAAVTALIGQPDAGERWRWIAATGQRDLDTRAVFVEPAEVVALRRDLNVAVHIIEVRPERDYNLFHLAGSRRLDPGATRDPALVGGIVALPENAVVFLAANGEAPAVEAWKDLKAQGALNLYVIAGGMNGWLDVFPPNPRAATRITLASPPASDPAPGGEDPFAWDFRYGLGDRIPSAHPEIERHDPLPAEAEGQSAGWFDGGYLPDPPAERKVILRRQVAAKGGCG